MVGLGAPDDAAVWRLDARRALVVTTDFFTPVVDDPFDFGQIAAANALSDLYAMGAQPFLALNLLMVPTDLPTEAVAAILRGGAEKVREAGAVLAGGHSVQDREPKYGLVAIGMADPEALLIKGGARPGDILVLTKPLGTGVTATALKNGRAAEKRHTLDEELGSTSGSLDHLGQVAEQTEAGDIGRPVEAVLKSDAPP
ncbi:MAG: selD, partial [Anaerolineales bacterium]|nr:selD [Anaerolineales bacterium]